METFDAEKWARFIRQHKNPLVVAGEGCSQIPLAGKGLLDHAVALAARLSCPVAATGNTVLAIKEKGGVETKKIWLAELFRYLEGDWEDPMIKERPDLLLLIGYRSQMVQGMVTGARDLSVAHLGPGELPCADLSMEASTLKEWSQNLESLVQAL